MKSVSPEVMSEIDRKAIGEFGIPGVLLMENAGLRCWEKIRADILTGKGSDVSLTFAVGTGNNGGDALVIARQAWISGYRNLNVLVLKENGNEAFNLHKNICIKYGIPLFSTVNRQRTEELIGKTDFIIDGITGTGLNSALRGEAAEMVEIINRSRAGVVSVDIPSGLGTGFRRGFPVVNADWTLTIGLPKSILYYPEARKHAGRISLIKIGFPPQLLEDAVTDCEILSEDDFSLPPFDSWAYKGTRGHAGIFAGAPGTSGAAVLAAEASGRSGTGLVTLFAGEDVYTETAARTRSVMAKPLEDFKRTVDFSPFTALLAGPGWGTSDRSDLLKQLFASGLPGVLDADGLNVLAAMKNTGTSFDLYGRWIFTPHPGEFSRMAGTSISDLLNDPVPYLIDFASALNCVIVFKTHVIFIVTPDGRCFIVDGMNPAIGTGGSGDILSGIITGLLARGMSVEEAAVNGVLAHQIAGRKCFEEKGWFMAEDLLPWISLVMKEGSENA